MRKKPKTYWALADRKEIFVPSLYQSHYLALIAKKTCLLSFDGNELTIHEVRLVPVKKKNK